MSTKTSIKRIALVAVTALGFGMLSVVPAKAAAADSDLTYNFTTTGATTTPVVGTAVVVPFTLEVANGEASTGIISAELTTLPTNSALDAQGATTADASTYNSLSSAKMTAAATASTSTVGAYITHTWVSDTTEAATAAGSFGFTPDVPGNYVMTLTTGTGTGTDEFTAAGSGTTTLTIEITVEGAQLVQAFSGLGANSGTQISGRGFAAAYTFAAGTTTTGRFVVTATGATITAVNNVATLTNVANATSSTTTAGVTKVNGTDFKDGVNFANQVASQTGVSASGVSEGLLIAGTATEAGTAYIYIKSINATTGVLTTVETITVTITSSANSAISAANSTIGIQSTSCPTVGSSKTDDVNILANDTPQEFGAAAGGLLHVCIYTRDGNGTLINAATSSSIVTTRGYIGTTATPTTGATNPAAAASSLDFYLLGVSTMTGSATVTATLIDAAGYAVTLSAPVTWYGSLKTLELAPNAWSAQPYADGYGTSAPATSALALTAKDANGNQIDLATAANGVTSARFTVDSSGNAGAAAARTSDSLGATVTTNFSSSDLTTYGVGNFVSVSCLSSTAPEKLTITAYGTDSLGAWVASNSVDYYCSSSTVASLTVTPAATEVAKAGSTTVDVVAKDASGFIVPDGTAVSWAATSGTVIANSTSTLNGSLKYDATYTAADADGKVVVTAVAGTRGFSATAAINVGTGSSETATAVDAANEATDAANAATDAANAAAEAADAATAAAQDAQAAVADLAAQVATLIAGIKAQITSLTNLVIKIQKKVKA